MTPLPPAIIKPKYHTVHVLLVDDAAQVRKELGQLLELSEQVCVIGEAGNGAEAVQLASDLNPDVVIMDLEMPVMDGYQATRRIKSQVPAPRVVILSVHAGPIVEYQARAAGADHFIVKGSDYQTLLDAVLAKDE
jgi:DNA-binding NarL/FixJ family response regulator